MRRNTIVITQRAKLDLKLNSMVVRLANDLKKVSLTDIDTVVIESNLVSITTALLVELGRQKIRVILCDEKHLPFSEIQPYYACHDCTKKILMQSLWSDDTKGFIWQSIVRDKIMKQADNLYKFRGDTSVIQLLWRYASEVDAADSGNREGLAAKAYFSALFGNQFTRDEPTAINSALNYGYQILLSMFARSIKVAGYLTEWGIFHKSQHNHFNLASDLMEAFRPLVDCWVFEHNWDSFGVEEKHKMQMILDTTVVVGGKNQNLGNAVELYTNSILDALNNDDVSRINEIKYE